MSKWHLIFFSFLAFISCQNSDKITHLSQQRGEYIFLSHCRTNDSLKIIPEVEKFDFSPYDLVLLGGDLAQLSSKDTNQLNYLDSIFNLSSPNTLWTLGNHDYTQPDLISQYTNRPLFYSYYKNGISFLVLDTQDSVSQIVGKQKQLLSTLCDTISQSSHLILMTHQLIWLYGHPQLEAKASQLSNGKIGDCNYCINPNPFYTDLYPELLKVKNKGIEVICLAGDMGFKQDTFDFTTKDDIHFLATGMDFRKPSQQALFFQHDTISQTLSWEFKLLK